MIPYPKKQSINCRSVFLFVCILFACAVSPANALEQVTLQLKWVHQFQFAGYYAALQQGYYRDAGLDVIIKPATPGKDPALEVVDGRAEYGVGTSSLLLMRNTGTPVVTLAVIFQHSPYILLTGAHTPSQTIHNLAGKRLMLEPQADELVAYLSKEGIPINKMQLVEHSFNARDLIDGKVDAISGYVTDDPYELEQAGFPYHAYTPRSAGIDFYGDNLFTTESELKKHPARVKAFREASLKGWQYALQHPDEIINLIVYAYSTNSDRAHLKYEAEQIRQLIQPNLVEIGYMHTGRWQHIADTYKVLGLLPKSVDFKKFIYNPHPNNDYITIVYWIAFTLLGLLLVVIGVRLVTTSHNLKKSEEQIRKQYNEIQQINESLEEQVIDRTKKLQKLNEYEYFRSQILELLAEDVPLAKILEAIVLGMEELNPMMLCSILLLDSEGRHLGSGVAPSLPDFYNEAINGVEIGVGAGSCGTAAFTGERVIVDDIATHPYWAPYKDLAARAGLGACWSQPVLSSTGKVLGTFAIYHRTACSPDEREIKPIEQAANLASIAIDKRLISEALKELNESLELRVYERTVELLKSKSRIDQLCDQSGTIIWEVDDQGLYTYVNHVSEVVLGYRPEEMVDRLHFYDMFPESERQVASENFLAVLERKEQIINLENEAITKEGRLIWRITNAIPVLREDGTLHGYRGSDTDVTESRKLKEQLLQSQKMEAVGQLAGGLAHDFNNVLSVINGYCCLMQMDMEKDERHKEYLDKILTASGRAADLTRSMLTFSRTQVMHPQNRNLNDILSSFGAFIDKIIRDDIHFETSVKETALPVYVDGGQIEQVLINLSNNARDAMPIGGVLTIVTDSINIDNSFISEHGFGKPGNYAVITVSDTGTGMDEETRKKIFEPFFTTKAVDKGTGLGLAMVYGIINQHDGFIDVTSSPGHGTSFKLYLPIVDTKDAVSKTKTAASLEVSAGTETILIVDDSADLREFMSKLLSKLGYQVIVASDGQDAVDKFRDNADKIHLIVMDMIMPNKSGKLAYDEIRQIKPDAWALFSSGYSAKKVKEQGDLGKYAEFISKPVQPALLAKKIREMLDRREHENP